MRQLAGKTAFVTGGASGIGFALGRAFAEAGMQVMLADTETEALAAAVESLRDFGPTPRPWPDCRAGSGSALTPRASSRSSCRRGWRSSSSRSASQAIVDSVVSRKLEGITTG
jgi:NAD(P)-dependent dehydrogenase (short-subunit alcohol dehydrogenase family)